MTPQQKKADELVQKFRLLQGTSQDEDGGIVNNYNISKHNAIQCAIICVEEILAASPCVLSSNFVRGFEMKSNAGYWQSVLNELKSRL